MKTYIFNSLLMLTVICSGNILFAQNAYNKLMLEGLQAEKNLDLNTARSKYSQAIDLNSTAEKAYRFRGKVNFRLKDYPAAISDLTAAVKLSPKNAITFSVRGRSYMQQDDYANAITDYSSALLLLKSKDSLYPVVLERRAYAYYKNQQYNEAVSDYTTLISKRIQDQQMLTGSKYFIYYYLRGLNRFYGNDYTNAISDFKIYLDATKNDVTTTYYIGWANFKAGNSNEARFYQDQYFNLRSWRKPYFEKTGDLSLFKHEENYQEALEQYNNVKADLKEVDKIQSENLKQPYLKDDFDKLVTSWSRVLYANEKDGILQDSLRNSIIDIYAQLTTKPAISEDARRYFVQAMDATQNKKYQDAVDLYTMSLGISPYDHQAYYNMALIFELNNNFPDAIDAMKTYLKLYPTAPDARTAQDKIYAWEAKVSQNKVSYVSDAEVLNDMKDPSEEKGANFVIAGGLSAPRGDFGLYDTGSTAENALFTTGRAGTQNGFYIELGANLNDMSGSVAKRKLFSFHYQPILLSYSQNKVNWSSNGGFYTQDSIYTKGFRAIEIAQHYGVNFSPVNKLKLELYYRPAFCIPFNFEVSYHNPDGVETYLASGVVDNYPIRMSNSFGISIRYAFFAIGYEWYYTRYKFDFTTTYHDDSSANSTGYSTSVTAGKVPVTLGRLRVAFYL